MSEKNNGGPAFPVVHPPVEGVTAGGVEFYGLSIRDYFAAHAPAVPENWRSGDKGFDRAIDWRWYYADAMIEARG